MDTVAKHVLKEVLPEVTPGVVWQSSTFARGERSGMTPAKPNSC